MNGLDCKIEFLPNFSSNPKILIISVNWVCFECGITKPNYTFSCGVRIGRNQSLMKMGKIFGYSIRFDVKTLIFIANCKITLVASGNLNFQFPILFRLREWEKRRCVEQIKNANRFRRVFGTSHHTFEIVYSFLRCFESKSHEMKGERQKGKSTIWSKANELKTKESLPQSIASEIRTKVQILRLSLPPSDGAVFHRIVCLRMKYE